jgi:hypothetical protein
MSKQVKPEPVVVTTICSMCSLPWEQHGADPTTPGDPGPQPPVDPAAPVA